MIRFAALLMFAFVLGCGGQPSSGDLYAPTEIFYFEVRCGQPGPNCEEVKRLLETSLPKYKYTFSPGSSQKWPYYRAFGLDENVPYDSLVPPHRKLHQLVPNNDRPLFGGGKYVVMIELFSTSDSLPDYQVTLFHLKSSEQKLVATTGREEVHQPAGSTLSTSEIILRSVTRYSFK